MKITEEYDKEYIKIIAMYLPQFHRVPENDLWWGSGFTEWTCVKGACSLYEGHEQPRIPLNENYYDLSNKSTMLWQAQLMRKYGIYGMCFYHYYFKNGRKILEKPAENLLKWKDIDMPFCFSWANESWTRTWSKLSNTNTWSSKFEKCRESNTDGGMLLEQKYGEEQDWKEHLDYLLPFFRDERYIKIDDCPIFIIYSPLTIPCLEKMIKFWKKYIKENGFKDMYIIGTNTSIRGNMDATMIQEPQNTLRYFKRNLQINIDDIWNRALEVFVREDQRTYYCGFTGYDDTPRRGEGGTVLSLLQPDKFQEYFEKLLAKSAKKGNEFVFINAWNEWGEGMFLEPDQKFGYGYLEAIRRSLYNYKKLKWQPSVYQYSNNIELLDRYKSYWVLFDKWLFKLEDGHKVEDFFVKRGYKKIAIYGIGMVGQHLINELDKLNIIQYGIDMKGNEAQKSFRIYKVEEDLPQVDVIIVTVICEFSNIYSKLIKKVSCPIISIEEVIEEC